MYIYTGILNIGKLPNNHPFWLKEGLSAMLTEMLLGSSAVLGAVAAGGIYVTLPWTLGNLAKRQTLVAFCKDGRAKVVVGRGGKFKHVIMVYTGYHLNDPRKSWYDPNIPDWERVEDEKGKTYDDRPWFMREADVYWVGIPPFRKIYWYPFEWNEIRVNPATKMEEVWARKAKTDFVYIKPFTYATVMGKVENFEGIPLEIVYKSTIAIVNPFKTLFRVVDWLTTVNSHTNREAKNFIGGSTYDELKNEEAARKSGKSGNFSLPMVALTDRLNDDKPDAIDCGLRARYGVEIETSDLQSFDPPPEMRDATVQKYKKQQEGEGIEALAASQARATVMQAKAAARADVLQGIGRASALRSRLKALSGSGRMGELVIQMEAVMAQGAGSKIIWANNPIAPLVSEFGLAEMLQELKITPAQLKEMLRQLNQQVQEGVAA